jgi:hypothetical protein
VSAFSGLSTAADPEAAYYQSIEDFFVSRRGDPLFLSNADWLLIRRWRKAGTPLRVVLRGIADALDAHAHSWGRRRKVGSLAYCEAEVDAARDRWQRALALGEEPGAAAEGVLAGLAAALEGAPLRGEARALALRVAARLRDQAADAPRPREVEPALAKDEAALVALLRADAGAGPVAAVEEEAARELAPYAVRMPAAVLAQIRKDSVTRRLLALYGLPRLTVFGD